MVTAKPPSSPKVTPLIIAFVSVGANENTEAFTFSPLTDIKKNISVFTEMFFF
jgi:hypothetical protein